MTLREQIEAASAKATQEADDIAYYHGTSSKHRPQWEAYTALLDRLYRAGKLLVIEDEQEAVRRMARVIADSLGDDYDMVPLNKGEWIKARGMCGGFPRDINAPFRLDYDDAATAALAALKGENA